MKKLAGLDTLGKHGVEVGPAAPLRVVHPARAIVAPEKHTIVPSARPSRVLAFVCKISKLKRKSPLQGVGAVKSLEFSIGDRAGYLS